jgi:hypothetical protein
MISKVYVVNYAYFSYLILKELCVNCFVLNVTLQYENSMKALQNPLIPILRTFSLLNPCNIAKNVAIPFSKYF